jgi:hypothetical protein
VREQKGSLAPSVVGVCGRPWPEHSLISRETWQLLSAVISGLEVLTHRPVAHETDTQLYANRSFGHFAREWMGQWTRPKRTSYL